MGGGAQRRVAQGLPSRFPRRGRSAAKALLARIAADPRHHSLVSRYRREIAQRLFPDWSMALTRVDSVDPEQRAFCKGLRDVELNSTDEHRQFVEPFLASFRAWIR